MPLFPAAPPLPLRTKRNFKSLQLPDVLPPLATEMTGNIDAHADPDPGPTQLAPPPLPAGVKRRPPPLGSSSGGIGFLSPGGLGSARHSAVQATLSSTLAKLDMVKFDLRDADLRAIAELGQGNGGCVIKVEHLPSGTIMAKKVGC
jgi:mitogen-activated protein kinase kinase